MAIARSGTPQAAGNATAATSVTVTLATGTSAGDIDVVGMVTQAAGTAASIAASGWTSLGGSGQTGGGVQTWLWWKLHQAGDPTTVTVAISGAGAAYSWDAAAYSGADSVAPFGTAVGTVDSTADTTVTTNNITTTGTNSWLIWFGGTGSGSSILTPPTSVSYTIDKHIETGKSSALASAGPLSPQTVSGNGTQSGSAQSAVLNVEMFVASAVVVPAAPSRPLLPMLQRFSGLNLPQIGFPAGSAPAPVTNFLTLTANDVVSTATIAKQVGKLETATSTTTASLQKQAGKNLTATSTTTASLIKQVAKTLTVTSTTLASLLIQKVKTLTLSATVTTTASLVKQVNKPLSATSTITASLIKQVGKILSATSTTTAILTLLKVKQLVLTATVTTTATITRQIGKPLLATVTGTASLVKQVGKPLTRTVTTTASLLVQKVKTLILSATVTTTATISRQVGKQLAATVTTTATVSKRVTKTLSATVTTTASLVADFVAQLVGPFAARLGIIDVGSSNVTVADTVTNAVAVTDTDSPATAVVDSTGANVSVTDQSGPDVTTADVQP